MRAYISCIMFCVGVAFANGFYGNNSDIHWKAAGTDHFNFIYPAEYSSHASKVSAYAEAVYDSVVSRYHHDLPGRVNATLNNALYSNGNAISSSSTLLNIQPTPLKFPLTPKPFTIPSRAATTRRSPAA